MEKISKEQIEELAKWCGFKPPNRKLAYREWINPDGTFSGSENPPDFPHDLNACFKWIVPKAIQTIRVNEAIALRDAEERFFRKWLFMRDSYSQSNWSECLCLAVLKLIEEEKDAV